MSGLADVVQAEARLAEAQEALWRAESEHARRSLREELLARYEVSAGEVDGCEFICRRCLKHCGHDEGGDDLAGLCDDCWVEVDKRLRAGEGSESLANGLKYPPNMILDRLNLSHGDAMTAASMNDSGKSFEEIADWIEKIL